MVLFTHEQNIIYNQTKLNHIAYEQTIICTQLFAGHIRGSWPMKRKNCLHRMIRQYTCVQGRVCPSAKC